MLLWIRSRTIEGCPTCLSFVKSLHEAWLERHVLCPRTPSSTMFSFIHRSTRCAASAAPAEAHPAHLAHFRDHPAPFSAADLAPLRSNLSVWHRPTCALPHGRKPHVSAIGVAHRRRSTSATNVPSRPSILFLDTTVVYVWGTVVTVWDRIAPRLAGRRRGGEASAAKQEANKQLWMVGKAAPRRVQSCAS